MWLPRRKKGKSDKENSFTFLTIIHISLFFLNKLHNRPSAMTWSGTHDRTLVVGGYWDYNPMREKSNTYP
jgi:hypothetical protein